MKTVKCKLCNKVTQKNPRDGLLFCDRKCYMNWKRKNPNRVAYNGRVFISGYYYLYMPNHPKAIKQGRYIAEHRYVLEQKIGRLLKDNEIAHHINENKTDNRPENLELLTLNEHNKKHANERKRTKYGKFKKGT